jgi:pimeloyl-ACP methyl ester carboxylesterase
LSAGEAMRQPFTLEVSGGRRLAGYLDLPQGRARPAPAVVCCHGFKGFMEYGFFPHLAELLARRGIGVVRFNLTGAGMRPGDERVTDLAAFHDDTHSASLRELLEVTAAVDAGRLGAGRLDPDRLALFGHSRGGALAILAAAHPDWRERVRALVTWAAVATFDVLGETEKATWRREGSLPLVIQRTGQEVRVGVGMLRDLEAHAAELDVAAAAGRRRAPWLLVHGEADDTVPVASGRALAAAAAPPVETLFVAGGDHGLGGRHPFKGPSPPLIQAMNATQTWYRRHLLAS